jgi:multicomponent Na+:H+ antiporter subunit C
LPAIDLAHHYHFVGAVILFCIGLYSVIAQDNIVKKILGLNIMETSVFFLLVSLGYVDGGVAPLAAEGVDAARMVNPIPQALILTGIVVAVGTTSIALALATMIHRKYGTFDVEKILREEVGEGEPE